jgi:hypothetical protein
MGRTFSSWRVGNVFPEALPTGWYEARLWRWRKGVFLLALRLTHHEAIISALDALGFVWICLVRVGGWADYY